MKSEFSTSWNASVQPRKQRKYVYNAPLHIKHKFLSAHLSKSLKEKYGKRALPLRKGDEVLVMRGAFRKRKAKVSSVDLKNSRIALEGIQRSRRDGTKVNIYLHPSILQITALNLDDRKRVSAVERKGSKKINSEKQEAKETKNSIKEK